MVLTLAQERLPLAEEILALPGRQGVNSIPSALECAGPVRGNPSADLPPRRAHMT
jgi:hypothetical protein